MYSVYMNFNKLDFVVKNMEECTLFTKGYLGDEKHAAVKALWQNKHEAGS